MNAVLQAVTALPPFQAIADLVREHAAARPGQRALVQGQRSVNWGQLDAMVDRVAASLQRDGVLPQQRIAICAANSLEYAAVFLGALRAGAAVAPLPTGSLPAQLGQMVADSGAAHLFVDACRAGLRNDSASHLHGWLRAPALQDWLAPAGARPRPVTVQPDWPFNIIYSSGTTGTPKGIVQPHGMRWAHVARAEALRLRPRCRDAAGHAAVLQHHAGVLLSHARQGRPRGADAAKFDAASYLALAEEERATHTMLVPVQYQRILALPSSTASTCRPSR